MSNDYRKRWEKKKRTRREELEGEFDIPECFGDPSLYDDGDFQFCHKCALFDECGEEVAEVFEEAATRSARTNVATRQRRARTRGDGRSASIPSTEDRIPHEEDESFIYVLAYNGSLGAVETFLREAAHSIGSVPRVLYPSLFRRKKK